MNPIHVFAGLTVALLWVPVGCLVARGVEGWMEERSAPDETFLLIVFWPVWVSAIPCFYIGWSYWRLCRWLMGRYK